MALTVIVRSALAGLCSLSLVPIPALAWGPQGHETIATVARDVLAARNQKAANEIYAIIKASDLPAEFPVKPSAKKPHPKPSTCRMRTIASVANWPDCLRKTIRYSSTAKFHFDDVPLCPSSTALPPKASYCANGRCGSSALGDYIAILRDRTAAPGKRAEALSFVIHIVGDLHQPMHAVENGNDSGGNFVTLAIDSGAFPLGNGNADNLHSLWDGDLVEVAIGQDTSAGIGRVRQIADTRASEWSSSDPNAWVLESHLLAKPAYAELTKPPVCNVGAADGGRVTASYVSMAAPVVEARLAAAAVRLAAVLEDALKPQ